MAFLLIYLIKSTVYLALFYAFFLTVMRGTTFFRLNRMMLLVGTFVCIFLPLYTVTVDEVEGIQLPMQVLDEMLAMKSSVETDMEIPQEVVLSAQESTSTESVPLLPYLLTGVYFTGVIVFLIAVVRSFRAVWKLIASHPKQWKDGCWLVIIPDQIPSFSWSNYVVMNQEDYENYPQVLVHERMHYLFRHSYDILFMTLVNALHWFNPMVWLIRTELKQLHEFEADEGVINQGIDATQYQILLVRKAVGKKLYNIANGFNHTKLKKRITMMIKEKSNGWERLKWLVVVPVVMGAMLVFAQPEVKEKVENIAPIVNQGDVKAEIASLKKFFDEHLKASEKRTPEGFVRLRESTVHQIFLNSSNEVSTIRRNKRTFLSTPMESPYHTALSNLLREARANDRQETGEDEPHTIYLKYSAEANDEALLHLMKEAKAAFDILRSEYKAQGAGNIETTCPYRVYVEEVKEKLSDGIEVTLFDDKGEKVMATIEVKHINQLKEALSKLPVEKRKTTVHVSIKADKNSSMGDITAIKQVLREHYIYNLNLEVNQTSNNGQGTLYQSRTTTQKEE